MFIKNKNLYDQAMTDRIKFWEECAKELRKGAAAFSCEHGCKGITMKKRPHDPWLESITNTMPEYVGLNY